MAWVASRLNKYLSLAIIFLLISFGYIIKEARHFLSAPLLSSNSDIVYKVKPGNTINYLAYALYDQGLLQNPKYLILLSKLTKTAKKIQAGEYNLLTTDKPFQVLNKLVNGKVMQHSATFVEGWTLKQVLQSLAENQNIEHVLDDKISFSLMQKLSANGKYLEGQLHPETYYFTSGTTDVEIILRSYKIMQEKLHTAWLTRSQNLPYKTSYEALIVASLIEKESAIPQERPLISGVIVNRLKKNMLLQIDPTVIYGLGDRYRGKLTKKELRKYTPYNTYRKKGLPPTPIALASEDSLNAALHPKESPYLYFVAKGDGSHHFSKTLKEQQQAIKKYIRSKQTGNKDGGNKSEA